MKNQNKAFTLVELIVVITILAILGTIAFISLQGYSAQARDSRRISDIGNIKTSLELFSLNTGKYPLPDEIGEVKYEGDLVWSQGIVGDNVSTNLSRNLNKKPLDPLTELEYTYSTINSQTKYELLSVYESDLIGFNNLLNGVNATSVNYPKIDGNYNGLFVKTIHYYVPTPSLINAELIGTGLLLDEYNIKSQIITGGKNVPLIGQIESSTGGLDINLSVYTGSLDSESTPSERQEFITQLQGAYSGTSLANQNIYKDLLAVTSDDEEIENYVDIVVLNSGTYSSSNSVVLQWTGNETTGYLLEDSNGVEQYPLSCNDLLEQTIWKNALTGSPWDGTKFNDGFYWIKINTDPAFKIYCDMTIDGGGWTRINYNQSTQENYQRFRDCKNNGYYFENNFECINPIFFTNIKFVKNESFINVLSSNMEFIDIGNCINIGVGCRTGWSIPVNSGFYTMRDYNCSGIYNTGRWYSAYGSFQNEIVVYGK